MWSATSSNDAEELPVATPSGIDQQRPMNTCISRSCNHSPELAKRKKTAGRKRKQVGTISPQTANAINVSFLKVMVVRS